MMLKETDLEKNRYLDFNDAQDNPVMTGQSEQTQARPLCAKRIRADLEAQLEDVLSYLLPNGRFYEKHFEVGDVDGSQGSSLRVTLTGNKRGLWHDFATGEGGDIFDLWAAHHHLDIKTQFNHVLASTGHWLGLSASNDSVNMQIKPNTQATPSAYYYDELGKPTAKWDYYNAEKKLIACVYRYDTPHGKQYRPWDVVNRKHRAPNPRPLYNQPGVKEATQIVLVEGEKAANSLIEQGIAATTAMFGAKAPITKTDWSPLKGKQVVIWPDNDTAGKRYAVAVSRHLAKSMWLSSLSILTIPEDKPDKWDAADAVAQGVDVNAFIAHHQQSCEVNLSLLPAYTLGQLLDDTSPMPADLIAPRVLTPGGLMVLAGAPKVGKSDFLLSLLSHMAAGHPFLGLAPPRPLRIFYLQTEVGYHYLRERSQQLTFDNTAWALIRKNLVVTPQLNVLLNKEGVNKVKNTIQCYFSDNPIDIIVVDPLRNVYDSGDDDNDENKNNGMLFFLTKRLDALRDKLNHDAAIILAHHTRKLRKRELTEDPFQALSGASSLRGYYSTGMVLFKEDEDLSPRKLVFELRNGKELNPKYIDKVDGQWRELDPNSKRLVKDKHARQLEAESNRKKNAILQLIYDEARAGRLYTINQFSETFEYKSGLGGVENIRKRLDALATQGKIKFSKDTSLYGTKTPLRSKFGFLCVEGMQFDEGKTDIHPETGEMLMTLKTVYPTHYKCGLTSKALPMKDKRNWHSNRKGEAGK